MKDDVWLKIPSFSGRIIFSSGGCLLSRSCQFLKLLLRKQPPAAAESDAVRTTGVNQKIKVADQNLKRRAERNYTFIYHSVCTGHAFHVGL